MEMLTTLSETVKKGMNISLVFGNPVETQGKTIIPVSKVSGGFGGGEGQSPNIPDKDEEAGEENRAHGMGGGGGLQNEAIGVFEITANDTRFIPAIQFKHIIVMLGMILTFIWKISRKKRRR